MARRGAAGARPRDGSEGVVRELLRGSPPRQGVLSRSGGGGQGGSLSSAT